MMGARRKGEGGRERGIEGERERGRGGEGRERRKRDNLSVPNTLIVLVPVIGDDWRSFFVSNRTSGNFDIGTHTSVANPYIN